MENPFKPTITISDSSQIPDIMIDSEVRSSNIIRNLLENVGKYNVLYCPWITILHSFNVSKQSSITIDCVVEV